MVLGIASRASGPSHRPDDPAPVEDTSTTALPGVLIPDVVPGATLTTETPCPAENGSSPRTTGFIGPPPMCIDEGFFYTATIRTTEGDLVVNINPHQAPQAANNFVVLSLYHFYDGQPISGIVPRMAFAVRAAIDNPDGLESPGYTIPAETPSGGQTFMFGSIAMVPVSDVSTDFAASFIVATYEDAISLPQELTQFGLVVDGADTMHTIDASGNQSGQPTKVIMIDSITISKGVEIGSTGG